MLSGQLYSGPEGICYTSLTMLHAPLFTRGTPIHLRSPHQPTRQGMRPTLAKKTLSYSYKIVRKTQPRESNRKHRPQAQRSRYRKIRNLRPEHVRPARTRRRGRRRPRARHPDTHLDILHAELHRLGRMHRFGSKLDEAEIHVRRDVSDADELLDQFEDFGVDGFLVDGGHPREHRLLLSLLVAAAEELVRYVAQLVLGGSGGGVVVSDRPYSSPDGLPDHDFVRGAGGVGSMCLVFVEEDVEGDVGFAGDGIEGCYHVGGVLLADWEEVPAAAEVEGFDVAYFAGQLDGLESDVGVSVNLQWVSMDFEDGWWALDTGDVRIRCSFPIPMLR